MATQSPTTLSAAEFFAHDTRPHPANAGRGYASSDEYLSDDEELSDNDLNVLKTDYNLQRDLTFFPSNQVPIDARQPPPPHRLQHRRSAEAFSTLSERPTTDSHALHTGRIPPRDPTLRHTRAISCYDETDYTPPHHFPRRDARAYQGSTRRRPLIDLIKNEWRNNPSAYSSDSSTGSFDHLDTPTWVQICFAPRVQRSVLAFVLIFLFMWGNWMTWAGQKTSEAYKLRGSSSDRLKNPEGWFGVNMRPEFLDMVQVATLDEELAPGHGEEKRLIVIGDVHGCSDELVALLAEAQYEARTDHLIFTGDMIAKGPSSPAVVDLAISAHASCVRGNHEDRVLLTYRDLSAHPASLGNKMKQAPPAAGIPEGASVPAEKADGDEKLEVDESLDEEQETFSRLDIIDRHFARQLNKRQLGYLSQCPVILDIGPIPGMGKVQVVHAGLVPGVQLERQDPMSAMHMRTVDLDTHVPSSSGKGTAWYKLWNRYQSLLPLEERSTVIYGHDAHRGLQLEKYSKGLDTGCFKGGKLSALVIDKHSQVEEPKVVSVECKDYRQLEKDLIKNAGR